MDAASRLISAKLSADNRFRAVSLYKMNAKNRARCIRFRLAISAEDYLAYYQGSAKVVVARSEDNKTIRFPANAIRKFVTHDGIYGDFEISFDENNKLIAIQSID